MIKTFLTILILTSAAVTRAEVVEKTVAIVNNELVLESDFKELQKRLGKPGLVDDALLMDKTAESLKKDRKAQLEYLINEKLLSSEVKRLNLTITADRVDSDIRDTARRNNIPVEELLKIIKSQGLSESEYRAFKKEQIEKSSLMESEIISKLRISDEDAMNEYLKTNPTKQSSIDEFSVAHIFFNPKKGGAEEAVKRAENVVSRLQKGENFEVLAQQFSEDPNFSAGGSLGTFKSGEFLPEIENSISNLKVGETTPIVKSRMGFHVVKLTGKKLTPDPQFERAKEGIKSRLLEASFKRQLKTWLQSKKDEAFIRINE